MATLQEAINIARGLLQDTTVTYRYSDADLLQYGNDALDIIATNQPQWFYAIAELTCIEGKTIQTFNVADSLGLVDVLNVKDGGVVRKTDKNIMDRFRPSWHIDSSGAATEWMLAADDPSRFYIHPKAPANQVLVIQYIQKPAEYAIGATHALPNTFTPIIAKYIVAMANSRESGDAETAKASKEMGEFYSMIGTSN